MQRRRDLIIGLGTGVLASAAGCTDQEEGHDEIPERETDPEDELILVSAGTPRASIVVDGDHSGVVDDAVEELNYWIEQMTGTTLPVETHDAWDGSRPVVAVGHSPLTDELDVDPSHLGEDGALVVSTPTELVLVGRDDHPESDMQWDGTYFAVREFVRSLGVRQIWPGELGEVSPDLETLTVEPDEREWEPQLLFPRGFRSRLYESLRGRHAPIAEEVGVGPIPDETWERIQAETHRWIRRHRATYKRPAEHDRGQPMGHAFQDWWERFGDEHPEWFAQRPDPWQGRDPATVRDNWKKLNLSNDDIYDQKFEDWYEKYQDDPIKHRWLVAGPNDGSAGYDTRPETRAMDEGRNEGMTDFEIWHAGNNESVLTERYVQFYNRFAERVVEVDEDLMVGGFAYNAYKEPPTHHEVHPNVLIAHVGETSIDPDDHSVQENWQAWADMGVEQMFWRPNQLGDTHAVPRIYMQKMEETLDAAQDFGMVGLLVDACRNAWGRRRRYITLSSIDSSVTKRQLTNSSRTSTTHSDRLPIRYRRTSSTGKTTLIRKARSWKIHGNGGSPGAALFCRSRSSIPKMF